MTLLSKRFLCASAFVVVLFVIILAYSAYASDRDIVFEPNTRYRVAKVIDGDTFKVAAYGKYATVRLLGLNSPETVDPRKAAECFGKEASDYLKNLILGREVYITANPNREAKDKYGRYLAYASLSNEETINKMLLSGGYAREYTFGKPYLLEEQFKLAEASAKESKKGLWGACVENSSNK